MRNERYYNAQGQLESRVDTRNHADELVALIAKAKDLARRALETSDWYVVREAETSMKNGSLSTWNTTLATRRQGVRDATGTLETSLRATSTLAELDTVWSNSFPTLQAALSAHATEVRRLSNNPI